MSASKQTFLDYQVQQYNDYSACEWQEIYEDEQLAADYLQWQIEEAERQQQQQKAKHAANVPAVAAPSPSFFDCLIASHNAVSSTLSELTTLLLNVGSSYLRHDIHRIATDLVNKSGLQDEVKANYMQMLDAASLNAQQYFNNNMAAA